MELDEDDVFVREFERINVRSLLIQPEMPLVVVMNPSESEERKRQHGRVGRREGER